MIVGLAGYARAGKDTIGKILVEDHGFKRIALADKMKEALAILNPVVVTEANGDYGGELTRLSNWLGEGPKEHGFVDYEAIKQSTPMWHEERDEVRRLLQVFGTEVGRQLFGPDFWIDLAVKDIDLRDYRPNNYVFTDIRFPNEASYIKNLGGKTYWVMRSGNKPANNHISELALLPEHCDGVIYNNRSNYIDHLKREVKNRIVT